MWAGSKEIGQDVVGCGMYGEKNARNMKMEFSRMVHNQSQKPPKWQNYATKSTFHHQPKQMYAKQPRTQRPAKHPVPSRGAAYHQKLGYGRHFVIQASYVDQNRILLVKALVGILH